MTDDHALRAAFRRGDSDSVRQTASEQLVAARRIGDRLGEIEALYALSRVALRDNKLPAAVDAAQEALDVARKAGDRALEERPLHVLAAVARLSGDHARAKALYEASISLNRELGNVTHVHTEHHNLALTELHLGNIDRARALITENEERVRRGGLDDFVPYLGLASAALALADEDPRRAARMIGFTERAFAGLNQVPDPDDARELAALRDRVADVLDADAVQTEFSVGAEWSATDAFGGIWPGRSS